MSRLRSGPLRAAARVALIATALAALIYVAAAAALLWVVAQNLSQQVDNQLADQLVFLRARPGAVLAEAQAQQSAAEQGHTTTVTWIILADGSQLVAPRGTGPMPAGYQDASGPVSVTVNGVEYRIVGGPLGTAWLMIGAPAALVTDRMRELVIGAAAVGVVVLAAIFLAALAIGRLSAEPIERARRRLQEFTADASHELRTPLQVIEAEVSLALMQERPAPSYRESIESIGRESGRLRGMVDDLLWLARFDDRPTRPPDELVDLGQIGADAVERFGSLARAQGQAIWLQADPAAPAIVAAPREWIDRLIGVLVDNACRYTPPGGSIRVVVEAGAGRAEARVEDSGRGIPPAERDRIFERFRRARSEGGGAGLGLAIGNAVVAATGGRWRVGESAEGGASVGVMWAAARVAGQPAAGAPHPGAPWGPPPSGA